MSKKERITAEIGILQALLITFLTAIFVIFAYCVINLKTINFTQAYFSIAGALMLIGAISIISIRLVKQLNQIEKE